MIELIFVVVCLGIIVRQHLKIRELKSDNEDLEYKLGKLSTNTKHINDLDSALMLGKLSTMCRSAERKRGATTVQRMSEKARKARESNLESIMNPSNVADPYGDKQAYSYDVKSMQESIDSANISDSFRGFGGGFSGGGSGGSWSDSSSSSSSSDSSSSSSSSSSGGGD